MLLVGSQVTALFPVIKGIGRSNFIHPILLVFLGGRLAAIKISMRRKVREIEALTIYARFGN